MKTRQKKIMEKLNRAQKILNFWGLKNLGSKEVLAPGAPPESAPVSYSLESMGWIFVLENFTHIKFISAPTLKIIIWFERYIYWDIYLS